MDADAYWQIIDVPRRSWDPTEGRHRRHGERSFDDITGLEVHWVGTGSVGDHGDTGTELLGFERFHERTKGWADLFYNVGLDTEGNTYEGRDVTIPSQSNLRPWLTLLCVVGDRDNLTDAELDNIERGIGRVWRAVAPNPKPFTIRVHGDRAATSCPGTQIRDLVHTMRSMPATPPPPPTFPTGDDTMQTPIDIAYDQRAQKWRVFVTGEGSTLVDEPDHWVQVIANAKKTGFPVSSAWLDVLIYKIRVERDQ